MSNTRNIYIYYTSSIYLVHACTSCSFLDIYFFIYILSAGLTKEKAPEESVYEPDYCEKQLIMWGHRCDPQNCITFCTYAI